MAIIYSSSGLAIDKGNPNSGQTSMRQIGRTLNWSGTSQYQTLIRFTKSGNSMFRFNLMLWYICSVRDNGEGRQGGYRYNSIYARYNVAVNNSNIYNDEFTSDTYPSNGDIVMPIQDVSVIGNNEAYIRFELVSGWSPCVITMGGYITCSRWDLLTLSYS